MNGNKIVDATRCMKCGFCMSVCPIYGVDHMETHVARGRNMLIRMARDQRLPMDKAYLSSLTCCLLCRRCETVCIAGLSPAEITIQARRESKEQKPPPLAQRLLNLAMLNHRSAVAKIIGMAAVLPGLSAANGKPLRHMAEAAALLTGNLALPSVAAPFLSRRISSHTKANAGGSPQGSVAIFPGCVFEYFLANIGHDMVRALTASGFDVFYPKGLSCCGQAMHSTGDMRAARQMARRNIEILDDYEHIVSGCATCGSALKSYPTWFDDGDPLRLKAIRLAEKIHDFSEILDAAGNEIPQASSTTEPVTVTYHDPCHLKWHQGIGAAPRRLLASIPGIIYREMERADACCGLGGSFGLMHKDIGRKLQENKIAAIAKSGAQIVATACPGCLLSLRAGIRRHGLPVDAVHISQLLTGTSKIDTVVKRSTEIAKSA
jgi:glycolate oxidase iron-sulfur subunit